MTLKYLSNEIVEGSLRIVEEMQGNLMYLKYSLLHFFARKKDLYKNLGKTKLSWFWKYLMVAADKTISSY